MKKNYKSLLLSFLAITALALSACGDEGESTAGPQLIVEQFVELNYKQNADVVAFESAILKESEQDAVVVSLACQRVRGEKRPVSSGALVSVFEKRGQQWTMTRPPDEISSESLPQTISDPAVRKEIDALALELKKDLPKNCI